jgi:hypothetical protein
MNKVQLWERVFTAKGEVVEKVVETFDGAIRSDVSPGGVICIQEYTGKQTILQLANYSRMVSVPMTDEEILSTPGLGEWYQEQIDAAEAKRAEDGPDSVEH